MLEEIRPAEVFEQVKVLQGRIDYLLMVSQWLMWTCVVVAVLILCQILAKIYLFGRMIILLKRVEKLTRITELHARVTDDRKGRLTDVVKTETDKVKKAVEQVPEQTIEKLKEAAPGDSFHGH